MTSVYSIDNIKSRLLADTKAFEVLINTIPAKFYITEDVDSKDHESKYTYGKRKNTKNEAKKNALLQKKLKFDPSVVKDTVSLIEQKFNSKRSQEDDDDSSEEDEIDSDMSVEADDMDCDFEDDDMDGSKDETTPVQFKSFSDISREELLKKLHARIDSQRKLRKADDPKKAEASQQKRKDKKSKKNDKKPGETSKKNSQFVQEKVVVDESIFQNKRDGKKSADTIKDEGDFTFSKFEFAGVEKKKKGPSTAQQLLTKIENENKKLEALKETDTEKAKAIEEKKAWKKALQLSSGQKVRDDPKLLKKTLKRIEKKKTKSAGQWSDRKTKVKDDEAAKQAKREENIQARKDSVKNKKLGIKVKKQPSKGVKKGGSKPNSKSSFKSKSKPKK